MRALGLLLLAWYSIQSICLSSVLAREFPAVRIGETEGVIIPAAAAQQRRISAVSVLAYWTPAKSDVRALEERLPKFLEMQALTNATSREQVEEIRSRLADYARQYVGFVVERRKVIFLNALPAAKHPSWKSEYIEVLDRDSAYWHTFYDVQARTFLYMRINGVAGGRNPSNQAMQRTASKPAFYLLRVCVHLLSASRATVGSRSLILCLVRRSHA